MAASLLSSRTLACPLGAPWMRADFLQEGPAGSHGVRDGRYASSLQQRLPSGGAGWGVKLQGCRRRCQAAGLVRSGSSDASAVAGADTESALKEMKRKLMRSLGGTKAGQNVTPEEQLEIQEMIEVLEARNPTSDPIKSALISGKWALIYTAPTLRSSDEVKVDKYAGTLEGPFLARLKPATLGAVRRKGEIQTVDAEAGIIDNTASFSVLSQSGYLSIRGKLIEYPPIPGRGSVRLDVVFESFVLAIGDNVKVTVPLTWISPKGWVETTFLDADLRIVRGDKGSIFVTSRIRDR